MLGRAAQAQRGPYRRRLTPATLPGIVQAEDFDEGGEGGAYHDVDGPPFKGGWFYRPTAVGSDRCFDEGGGLSLSSVRAGEWLAYTVNVNGGGTYDVELRLASVFDGAQLHVELDGLDVTGPMSVPNTGSAQWYRTIVKRGVVVPAGRYKLRVVFDRCETGGGTICSLNWIALR